MRARFGPFTLDTSTRRLSKDGRHVPLSPKAFDALALLVAARPRVVPKEAFRARLWPDVHVGDGNLNVVIAEVRRALGESARQSAYVRTVDRVGYAFDAAADVSVPSEAEVVREAARDRPAARGALYRLAWDGGQAVLGAGEYLVGRHPSCDVWVDVEGVSRRHARVRVASDTSANIEDLGSTNGTLVAGAAVDGVTPLRGGDTVHLGPVAMQVLALAAGPTKRMRRG
jgi:DNA-binding winged helix-turn-helix (wHTH) protein